MNSILISCRPHPNMNNFGWQAFVVSIPEEFDKKNYLFDSLANCSIIRTTEIKAINELEVVITNICDKFNVKEYIIRRI